MEPRWKRCVGRTEARSAICSARCSCGDKFAGPSKSAAEDRSTRSRGDAANLEALPWMDATTKERRRPSST